MPHVEFKKLREQLGLTLAEWAKELGYGHKPNNETLMRSYETGKKAVPPWTARLAYMIYEHWCAEEKHLPDWPNWLKNQENNHVRRDDNQGSNDEVVPDVPRHGRDRR